MRRGRRKRARRPKSRVMKRKGGALLGYARNFGKTKFSHDPFKNRTSGRKVPGVVRR